MSKVPEIAKREANKPSHFAGDTPLSALLLVGLCVLRSLPFKLFVGFLMCLLQVSASVRVTGENLVLFAPGYTVSLTEVPICTFGCCFQLHWWYPLPGSQSDAGFVCRYMCWRRPQIRDADEMVLFDPS